MIQTYLRSFAAALFLCIVSGLAMADYSAVAFDSGTTLGWATRKTQQAANTAAEKACNDASPKKDCKVTTTKTIVRAEANSRIGYGRSHTSLVEAKKGALSQCGKPGCKVVFQMTKPGFYSLAKSEPDESGVGVFHLAHQFNNLNEANETAIEGCEKNATTKCTTIWEGAIPGKLSTASANQPAPIASQRSCRPNTPSIRCSSSCRNGDCTVTYENGCKMRVQVQPRFDSFNNQWTYPAPSC